MRLAPFLKSFFHNLRASETAAFRRWVRPRNINRARLMGLILIVFAFVSILADWSGIYAEFHMIFPVELAVLSLALLLVEWGMRRRHGWMVALGETVLFLAAVVWMFYSVVTRLDVAYAVPEFIVGVLALALMRILSPFQAACAFGSAAMAYIVVLVQWHHFEFDAAGNVVLVSILAFAWSWGTYRGRIMEFRNVLLVAQLQERNRELNSLTVHDSLTGLPNRRAFDDMMGHWWSDPTIRHTQVTLILIDVDLFKDYNDRYGHPAGDACLQKVANTLRNGLREDGTVMRIGGEEFAVTLEGVAPEASLPVAERLVERVAEETDVTISAGVATLRPQRSHAKELYNLADAALYQAKAGGRNRAIGQT